MGNGNSGSNAVEFEASRANLGNPTGLMRVVYHTDNTVGYSDYTNGFIFNAGGQVTSVPIFSDWGMLILILLLGGSAVFFQKRRFGGVLNVILVLLVFSSLITFAWAATITLDGQTDDWTGISPSTTDTPGDSSVRDPNEDILYGYMTSDSSNFYFRIDFANIPR